MKAIEVVGTIEEDRRVRLDEPLSPGVAGRVRLIILVGEDEPTDQEWLYAASQGGAFDFLKAPEEDRYTLRDGRPFDDARYGCPRSISIRRSSRRRRRGQQSASQSR